MIVIVVIAVLAGSFAFALSELFKAAAGLANHYDEAWRETNGVHEEDVQDRTNYEEMKKRIERFQMICYHLKQNNRVAGWLAFIPCRMEVVHMNLFSFNDLMQFGIFLLALLTFIYLICHK